MRDDLAIQVDHVWKQFPLTAAGGGSLKHLIVDTFRRKPRKVFTALSDVNFDVRKGETLGIIGRNGAGKSTLLSVISNTMAPTRGAVHTNGRISSLLELGAGFHPDLTGRENVFLYGSIMNIPQSVMKERFDEIVEFSGIGEFIDQPVRFYSSGMYVRLGFSVAVQIDPDILLVDEVLAVGDVDFQKRCIERMTEFRKSGKTLLLISHDLGTIMSISDRIAILDHGTIVDIGEPGMMVEKYRSSIFAQAVGPVDMAEWGTKEVVLKKMELVNADGAPIDVVGDDRIIRVAIHYEAMRRIETPVFGFSIWRNEFGNIFGSNTQLEGFEIPYIDKGDGCITLELDASQFQSGIYSMSFSVHSSDHSINYHRLEHALSVFIREPPRVFDGVATFKTRFKA